MSLMRKLEVPFELWEFDLERASDDQLLQISREQGLSLRLDEMHRVREYFREKGRNPTDVELQAIGQAWSEHSCYKSSKAILKRFIFNIEAPQNILVIKEDAGVVDFDEEHAYVVALESHNHPSAIEPYGGAATGIGGILRDVACMGAQPIALIDPLFFAPLDYADPLPKGVKHPKYLFGGVVDGIRDYGNRVGIPTVSGMVCFHRGYLGNCLVNVGCVGIVEKDRITRSMVRHKDALFLLTGGSTGRDGIHGVTFASEELDASAEEESRGAVQLGDPIMKEPLLHACLEAVEKGLVDGMKDCGGGGLSSVVGEMALAGGLGAEIQLDKVPLKEEGLAPWEIWISESQERMMLAVRPQHLEEVQNIFAKWDVPAVVVGRAIPENVLKIYYKGVKVLDLDLNFYTAGPEYKRPYELPKVKKVEGEWTEPTDFNKVLRHLLSDLNIASKEWVIRQYDHEVRGATIIKPLQGKIGVETHGDAAVIKPLTHSYRGLAVTCAVNPYYLEIDPYWGAASAVEEACRNLVAVGAVPHALADCLNYGNPEKPKQLGLFYESVRGLGDAARAVGIPFVSGNVSFYNEWENQAIPPTPTLLGCGMVQDVRKCITADFKREGNSIYLLGETRQEMGGSAFLRLLGVEDSTVPRVEFKGLRRWYERLLLAIGNETVVACHDLSDGGLAIALAEMCIGGDIGADISPLPHKRAEECCQTLLRSQH